MFLYGHFRKPSIPTGPSTNVAGRMSRFPGGSAQLEPLLGRQAGASSHLQATIPTLLQALSASESTVPRACPKSKPGIARLQLAGWPRLAEGEGSLRRGVMLTAASGEPAGRGLCTMGSRTAATATPAALTGPC